MIGRRVLRPEARPPTIRFRAPNLHLPLRWLVAGWLCVLTWRALCWLVKHPRSTFVLALTGLLVYLDAVLHALAIVLLAAGALCLWWTMCPGAFTRHLVRPVQLELREWLTYRRDWQPAMLTCGLSLRESWGGDLPTLRKVSSEGGRDVLRVHMLPGQTLEQWQAATAALAQTWNARQIRVRRVPNRPQDLDLLVTLRGARNLHVTERRVEPEPDQVLEPRGAFPRAPRGGAA